MTAARDKPDETPDATLRALWLAAAGMPTSAVTACAVPLPELARSGRERLDELVAQRLSGVPLAYLVARQHFMGHDFIVRPGVLIPRRETELLGTRALELLNDLSAVAVPRCIDVGTGCGNLAISLKLHCPECHMQASDLSAVAIELAAENAIAHGLVGMIEFSVGDLLTPWELDNDDECCHLIVCNPPYIPSAQVPKMPGEIANHEPAMAFDGGYGGVAVLRRLIREAPRFLAPGGWLVFEIGSGQGEAMVRHIEATRQFRAVTADRDPAGAIRVIAARR